MGSSLFISDLHLSSNDAKSQLFIEFCQGIIQENQTATSLQSPIKQLFILGDLFNTWLGDDVSIDQYQAIIDALKSLSKYCDIFVAVGNRDFLLGTQFAVQSGARLIDEPYTLKLGNQHYLLLHGDSLCTDDKSYQRFKKIIRHPLPVWLILHLPKKMRIKLSNTLRKASQNAQAKKSNAILDVNQNTVDTLMQHYPNHHLIHGHTHRQAIHKNPSYTRFVLGDWSDKLGNTLLIKDNDKPIWQTIQ